jgi:hypothetical protein
MGFSRFDITAFEASTKINNKITIFFSRLRGLSLGKRKENFFVYTTKQTINQSVIII